MSLGEYDPLVREVIDLPTTGKLLHGTPPSGPNVTRDYDRASHLAWHETYGPDELLWTDIREREARNIKSGRYWAADFRPVVEAIDQLIPPLISNARKSLPRLFHPLLDDIVADLHLCALSRALNGKVDSFHERMFTLYNAGGWPCGWEGPYPVGEIVAFFP